MMEIFSLNSKTKTLPRVCNNLMGQLQAKSTPRSNMPIYPFSHNSQPDSPTNPPRLAKWSRPDLS